MSLEVKDLSVSYGEKVILDNISFHLEAGQIIGLVAPNGTGKTTMFNAMMRFIPTQSGKILINEKEYSSSSADVLNLHKEMTFFPDQADLMMNFSGREHVQMYADIWSKNTVEVDDIIDLLQMRGYVDQKVKTYSLGMKQRLCFAMMVAANTPVMLMDEVMNGLDPENVSLVSSILIQLKNEGKIIIVSSHLLDNLDEYADKVFFLNKGHIQHVTDWADEMPVYYKTVLSSSKIQELDTLVDLPKDTIHLGNKMLCIPIEGFTEEEQLRLFKTLRQLQPEQLSVGSMGTSEYYSYIYSLPIHVTSRGGQGETTKTIQ